VAALSVRVQSGAPVVLVPMPSPRTSVADSVNLLIESTGLAGTADGLVPPIWWIWNEP
jgi:hypothetical protein